MARKAALGARAQLRAVRLRPTPDPSLDVCGAEAGDLPLGDGEGTSQWPSCGFTTPLPCPGRSAISRWVLMRGATAHSDLRCPCGLRRNAQSLRARSL